MGSAYESERTPYVGNITIYGSTIYRPLPVFRMLLRMLAPSEDHRRTRTERTCVYEFPSEEILDRNRGFAAILSAVLSFDTFLLVRW